MRNVALIYNPFSGQYSARREAAVQRAVGVLRNAGIKAEPFITDGAGSGTRLALDAVRAGFDTIIACGGDGTVHEVLQSVVGTGVALGVVPLGTANALAADLGLIGSPENAVRALLNAVPTQVSVGRIQYRTSDGESDSRYFAVAAGVGADALLMARMDSRLKLRLGYLLYMIEATKILFTHGFPMFQASLPANANGQARVVDISQLLAVRVRSFGGALGRLAPGASVRNGSLSMIAFKTRNRFQFVSFLMAAIANRQTFGRDVELVEAESIECNAHNGSREQLFVEADGEVLGMLPVKLEVVPHALTLLVPLNAQP
jgi:YegS/Rv2252/BmrU family lipid kinase